MNHPNRYRCSLNQHLLVRYIFVHTRNNSFVHTRNVQSVRIPYILSIYISGGRNVWIFIQVCSSRNVHGSYRLYEDKYIPRYVHGFAWMSCASRAGYMVHLLSSFDYSTIFSILIIVVGNCCLWFSKVIQGINILSIISQEHCVIFDFLDMDKS
jgi:hypothetical protein